MNQQTTETVVQLRLDAEGRWYQDGIQVMGDKIVKAYFKGVRRAEDGRYQLKIKSQPIVVRVEDVTLFVTGTVRDASGYTITLSDGSTGRLDIASLEAGDKNQLYCQTGQGVRARFLRKPCLEFIKTLSIREGYYGVVMGDLFYPVQSVAGVKDYQSQIVNKPVVPRPLAVQLQVQDPRTITTQYPIIQKKTLKTKPQSKPKTKPVVAKKPVVKKMAKKVVKKVVKKAIKKIAKKIINKAVKKTFKKVVAKKSGHKKIFKKKKLTRPVKKMIKGSKKRAQKKSKRR